MTPTEAVCDTLLIARGDGPVPVPCAAVLIDRLIGLGMDGHGIAAVLNAIEDTFHHLPLRTLARVN